MECVINISEGRRPDVVAAIAAVAGRFLLDVHTDADHHRSVLTLAGPVAGLEAAAHAVARATVERIDITAHQGVHPRIGALDVVPFVPLQDAGLDDAVAARNRFAAWATAELALPCVLYGPERSLPEARRAPAATTHPTAGMCAVGARDVLVAYNVWLTPDADLATAQAIARDLRSPAVRALGLPVGTTVQVSCNLVAPLTVGPAAIVDAVASRAAVARTELVGLVPDAVVAATDPGRWSELDLAPSRTIEARLREAGLDAPDQGRGQIHDR